MAGSKDIINSLKAGGMSYNQIAQKLGRDSSLISQIARGKKPGKNLEASLRDISEKKATVKEPARRLAKSGEVAKVRKSAKPASGKLLKDKQGRIKFAPSSSREQTFVNRLSNIATAGGKVSFRVKFKDGSEDHIFRKGGIFAQRAIRDALNFPGGAFEWLAEQAASLGYNPTFGEVDSVEIIAVY